MDLRGKGLLATAPRQVQAMTPADHFKVAIQALPDLNRRNAGSIKRSAQRLHDAALGVCAGLELRHVIRQFQLIQRNFYGFQLGDTVPRFRGTEHIHLNRGGQGSQRRLDLIRRIHG